MAKKKQKSSGRTAKQRTKKKVTKKRAATSKKSSPKKATTKSSKKATKKATKARGSGPGAKSVDGVLKKYEKERSAQGSQLATLAKKIAELQAKTRVFQTQIAKLQGQKNALQVAIAQHDSRRDEEVGKLLAELGVQLSHARSNSTAQTPAAAVDDQDDHDADAKGEDARKTAAEYADEDAAEDANE